MTDPDGLDRDIRDALATALRERNRMIYWRLLLIFVAVVMAATVILWEQSKAQKRFEHRVVVTCHQNQTNARNLNDLIDRLQSAYGTSPVLTPQQREARTHLLQGAKQTVPSCPPRR